MGVGVSRSLAHSSHIRVISWVIPGGRNILPKEDMAKANLLLMSCSVSIVFVGVVIVILTFSYPEIYCGQYKGYCEDSKDISEHGDHQTYISYHSTLC